MKAALLPMRIEQKLTTEDGKPTRELLIARYGFTPEQVKTKPVKRFLLYKLSLDTEILKLAPAHGKERFSIVAAVAAEFDFTENDLRRAPNLEQAIRSLVDSLSYKAQLQFLTEPAAPAAKPITPTYPTTEKK
jgi:hypothetical protein